MVSCLKKDNPSLFLIHCVVHRQHLVGNCLARFHKLYSSILEHVEKIDIELHGELKNIKYDLAYLSDIFKHLNINNTFCQGLLYHIYIIFWIYPYNYYSII